MSESRRTALRAARAKAEQATNIAWRVEEIMGAKSPEAQAAWDKAGRVNADYQELRANTQ